LDSACICGRDGFEGAKARTTQASWCAHRTCHCVYSVRRRPRFPFETIRLSIRRCQNGWRKYESPRHIPMAGTKQEQRLPVLRSKGHTRFPTGGPAVTGRVLTDDATIRPSRLITGTPKCTCRRYDAVRHIWHLGTGYFQHCLHDFTVERRFLDHVFRVRKRLPQTLLCRQRQPFLFDEINDLRQTDRRKQNIVTSSGCISMKRRAATERLGFLSKYQRAAWVSATPAITVPARQSC
jgi:hypothetical protein